MKRLILTCAAIVLSNCLVLSQWEVIHQSGLTSGHADLFFLNADTGYVLGAMAPPDAYVLRTMNGGITWDSTFSAGFSVRSIHFPSADTGYISGFTGAGANLSVMRTINGGDSWEVIATDLHIGNFHSIPIRFVNNNTGFISHPAFFAKTEDAGITWEILESWSNGPRDLAVNPGLLLGASGAFYKWSFDLGQSWILNQLTESYLNSYSSHIQVDLKDHRLIACSSGANGQAIGFPQYGYGIITIGNLLTEDFDITYFPTRHRVWNVAWPGEETMYGISTSIYLGDDYPHFFIKSIDGGQTWYEQSTPEYGYPGTNKLACPTEEVCYAIGGAGSKIYKTSNGGGPLLDPLDQVVLNTQERVTPSTLTLHPNPAHTFTTLTSAQQPMERLALYDLQGRLVHEAQPAALSYRIPLAGLPAGMYVLQVQVGSDVVRKKVLVE